MMATIRSADPCNFLLSRGLCSLLRASVRYHGRSHRSDEHYDANLHRCVRPRQVTEIDLRASVERTPLFSLRENAIAQEPGLSYPESWRCVSWLGASVVAQTPSSLPRRGL